MLISQGYEFLTSTFGAYSLHNNVNTQGQFYSFLLTSSHKPFMAVYPCQLKSRHQSSGPFRVDLYLPHPLFSTFVNTELLSVLFCFFLY